MHLYRNDFIFIIKGITYSWNLVQYSCGPFNKLYKKILQFSDELNISFEDLLNYRPNHTKCDHGLVSAGLIFQSVVFCNYLIENCKKNKDISLSWYNGKNTECFCDEENVEKYASIIFSILIHNIYTKKSGAKYGIKYAQDIDKNHSATFVHFVILFKNGIDQSK